MKLKLGHLFITDDPGPIVWLWYCPDGLWVGFRMAEAVKVTGDEADRLWALLTANLAESDGVDKVPRKGRWKKP